MVAILTTYNPYLRDSAMKKKLLIWIIGITVTPVLYSCAHLEKSPEKLHVYNFESRGIISSDDSKKMIRELLGTKDVGDAYRSEENILYYASKKDVSETFEHDLNNG